MCASQREYKKSSDNPVISAQVQQEKPEHRELKKEFRPYKINYTDETRNYFCLNHPKKYGIIYVFK